MKLEILQLVNLGTQAGSISLFFLICCLVSPECRPVTVIGLVAAIDRFRMHAVAGYDLITSMHENRRGVEFKKNDDWSLSVPPDVYVENLGLSLYRLM